MEGEASTGVGTGAVSEVMEPKPAGRELPSDLGAVLSALKDQLTDVSRKNRSVRLLRLNLRTHFDLAELIEDPEKETPLLLEKIRKQKNLRLAAVLSKEEDELKAGYRLNHVQRQADFIRNETGNYDVYIGYPFAEGRFADGTYFKAPLALFPVTLEKDYRRLEFTAKPDADREPILNRAFLVAYQKFNNLSISQEIDEAIGGEGDVVEKALERFAQLGIRFEGATSLKHDKLVKFRPMGHDAAPRELAGRMRVVRNAVLGLFPQTSSTLVSDYDELRRNPPKEGLLPDFFKSVPPSDLPALKEGDRSFIVTDVDASQERVVAASRKVQGLAIYGPPGTGKSQVIVNLIADRVARGEKVLVVCEKRAALDVVYNRLRGLGLNDFAVVVHDYEKDRNHVFEKTLRVIEDYTHGAAPQARKPADTESADKQLKQLLEYNQSLQTQLSCGATLYQLYSEDPASRVKALELGELAEKFTFEQVKRIRAKFEDIVPLALSAEAPYTQRKDFSRLNAQQWRRMEHAAKDLQECDAELKRVFATAAWERLGLEKGQLYPNTLSLEKGVRTAVQGSLLKMADSNYWKTRNWLDALVARAGESGVEHRAHLKRFMQGKDEPKTRTAQALKALFDYNESVEKAKACVQILRDFLGPEAALGVVPKASGGETATEEIRALRQAMDDREALARRDAWISELSPDEHVLLQLVVRDIDSPKEIPAALDAMEHSFYQSWISQAEDVLPHVKTLDPETHARKRREGLQAFEESKKSSRSRVKAAWREGLARIPHSELKYIKFQAEKPAHKWPLRKFASAFADRGLLGVFPVWLASPETVSALFPLTPGLFDLVVFDEASQCPLEHAIPALFRAKAAVVAGDEKQLPPFDLFESYLDEFEETGSPAVSDAKESQSFLQLAKKRYPELLLQWHYRSKHHPLIDFSNRAFYGGRMAFVPDADEHDPKPIEWVSVPGKWEGRKNRVEAEKIVELVAKIISQPRPPSVGVITFNHDQRELIENLLERRARKDPQFYVKYRREKERMQDEEVQGLFVKNIENVQGDERDVILFSIGYAPTETGPVVAQFGSLGIPGGENRLNVAVSRAREKIYVVASISPLDLHTDDAENPGPRLLKKYLEYAKLVSEGNLPKNWFEGISPDSGLESEDSREPGMAPRLMKFLAREGLRVADHVAAQGAIDLAVVSGKKGKFLLGIECDGRQYADLADARQWEVYRPNFLRKRGWNAYHVSARTFWLDPQGVFEEAKSLAAAAERKG